MPAKHITAAKRHSRMMRAIRATQWSKALNKTPTAVKRSKMSAQQLTRGNKARANSMVKGGSASRASMRNSLASSLRSARSRGGTTGGLRYDARLVYGRKKTAKAVRAIRAGRSGRSGQRRDRRGRFA